MNILPNKILIKYDKGVFNLFINNKELLTPNKNNFDFENKEIVLLIDNEIKSQKQLNLNTSIYYKIFSLVKDELRFNKLKFVNSLMRYAETDLICYWESEPKDLYSLQEHNWKNIFDLLKHEKLNFKFTTRIIPIKQKQKTLYLLREKISNLSNLELGSLMITTEISGSVLLSFLFIKNKINSNRLFENCYLHHEWQSKKWGIVNEEQSRRKNDLITFQKIQKLIELINV